jgi:hypothetical protein
MNTRRKSASIACFCLLAISVACGPNALTQYPMGQSIKVGSYTLSISSTEMTYEYDQTQLVVSYRCMGPDWNSLSPSDKERYTNTCRSDRFVLVDGSEHKYSSARTVLRDMYFADRSAYEEYYSSSVGSHEIDSQREAQGKKLADEWARGALLKAPEDWVIVFEIPQNARNFHLLIDTGTSWGRDLNATVKLDR